MKEIVIKGAREHNLKNLDLTLPRDAFIVVTGLSGSGKSTLAFDTLYAEGQRRYVESLSAYARQFLGLMNKPDVESITGLSPAISIEQKTTSRNPRSTVGTVTEIYDYLRLLFARIGTPHCPEHGIRIEGASPARIAARIAETFTGRVTVLAPVVRKKKGHHQRLLEKLRREGILRARVNGKLVRTDEPAELPRYEMHTIEAVLDRLDTSDSSRLAEAVERAVAFGEEGLVTALAEDGGERTFSSRLACPECGLAFEELQPRMFSFNSPFGACEACSGLGVKMEFDESLILPDHDLSISQGAIMVYRNAVDGWRGQYLGGLAEHYGFTLDTPIRELTPRQYEALMHGSDAKIRFELVGRDSSWSHNGEWEGLLPQCERLYRQTESEYRRTELEKFMRVSPCPDCRGLRLKRKVLAVRVNGKSIADVTGMSVGDCAAFFAGLELPPREAAVARAILKEIRERLAFLEKVGLSYLTLDRSAGSLSGGEAQRIRLATQIGTNLTGVLYILDEPSIGLHPRDNARLIETLHRLRDLGNTLVVVEHDEATIRAADHVVDLGPGAGIHGGEVVAQGTPAQIERCGRSLTGLYLAGKAAIALPGRRRTPRSFLHLRGCRAHNLKGVDVRIPLGAFACVTGVSGSGKSTLVHEILYKALAARLHGAKERPGAHDRIDGADAVEACHVIDQSPIGRTPRSNPATYTKVFDEIRRVFADTKEARRRGYGPGRFSFNLKGGRCEACDGDGLIKIEMNFLPDVYVPCEECKGRRYNAETLEVGYRGKSIADVLDISVEEAVAHFENVPPVRRKLEMLDRVGLSYIKLGQSSTTLSGGEAQRIKLTRELAKSSHGRTLYLLDEPTTGLHFHDVKQLLALLHGLVERGASVVVIEHNLDVIASADWVLDLGPEGGEGGGRVVAEGTPERVAQVEASHTGRFLAERLRGAGAAGGGGEAPRGRPRKVGA